jgi:hypothetical protein
MTDLQFLLLLPIIFAGGIVSVITGGGLSMILVLVGSMFIDLHAAVVLDAYLLLANQAAKTWHFHRSVHWDVVGWSLLLGFPSTYLGSHLLFAMPADVLGKIVAVLAIVFVCMQLFKILPRIPRTRTALILTGAVSGFVGGATGNSATVRKPLFLAMGLTKEVFVGTTAMLSLLLGIPRLVVYAPHTEWTSSYTIFLGLATVLLFIGARIGKYVITRVSPKTFETMLYLVTIVGSVRLLTL